MNRRIEKSRLQSIEYLPDLPGEELLEFKWNIIKKNEDYWSIVTLKDNTPVFEEMAYSCDGKYFSHSKNHYQEICGWLKKKYGRRFKNIELTFEDYDCGCYFVD